MSDERIEILCRNREEFVEDYLLQLHGVNRDWAEEMAIAYEKLSEGDLYPVVMKPKKSEVYDYE